MNVSFLGLGAMGRPMAANLIKAGHHVRIWNRSRGPVNELVRQGAEPAADPRQAFRGVVFSMLADDNAVQSVILDTGALDAAPPDTVHVNLATISVALAERLSEAHERRGVAYVAAPVFGRPDAAAAGHLNIIAAGDPAILDRLQPLLDVIGQRTWRIGTDPKQANAAKIAGNFLIAAAIESMAEAMTLAERHGVVPEALLEALTNSLFAAPVYKNYGAMIVDRRYDPAAFRLVLGLKDVRLALEAADAAHVPMPFASVLRDNLLDAVAQGQGDRDWAALADVTRRRAGLPT